jgi:hypothetical protein
VVLLCSPGWSSETEAVVVWRVCCCRWLNADVLRF